MPDRYTRSVASIQNTADIILIHEVDYATSAAVGRPIVSDPADHSFYAWIYDTHEDSMHFGGGNMAFVDGHVKWLKSTSVPETDARFNLQ